jgi:drug/metabolite transporter (DMT)-like permease
MSNFLLFITTSLIWGTTWYAVKIQSHSGVSPLWSIAYRFLIASLLFFMLCRIKRRSLNFSLTQHLALATQGISLFSLSYICVYYSSLYLISGILALICGSTIVLNVINERIFLKRSYSLGVTVGVGLGILGLLITLWDQVFNHVQNINPHTLYLGIILGILSSYFSSMGNILSIRNKHQQLPVLEGNTLGMFYGGVFTVLVAILCQQKLSFDMHLSYVFSLGYLIIFGSLVAFQCFLTLVTTVGATRAGYVYIITPIIAMIISTFNEGVTWKSQSILGLTLIILGNILIMRTKKPKEATPPLGAEEKINV